MGSGWSQEEQDLQQQNQISPQSHHSNDVVEPRNKPIPQRTESSNKAVEPRNKPIPQRTESSNNAVEPRNKPIPQRTESSNNATEAVATFPHKYEEIIKDADSSVDRSSMDKLYDQLYVGVFLNQKHKKYWVDKKSNGNCFMLYATELLITWSENTRFWHWPLLQESSDVFIPAAELLDVCWLEIHGRFNTVRLTPGLLYEVVFIVMLKDPAYGWENPVNLRLTLPDGSRQGHKENMLEKPRAKWIEIPAGEFLITPEKNIGEIEFSLYEYEGGVWKRGLVIKGAVLRPKRPKP